jgi:hypothetical protein
MTPNDQQYKEAAYSVLFQKGCVIKDERDIIKYYSNALNADYTETKRALKDLQANGINIGESSLPSDGYGSAFNGTDANNIEIEYMSATIVSNSGAKYFWAVKVGSLSKVIKLMTNPMSLEDALVVLGQRLEQIEDSQELSYNSGL